MTWTVTTTEDDLSVSLVGEEALEKDLSDVGKDDDLSLSGMAMVDGREVEMLSLFWNFNVVVSLSLSLSDAGDEVDNGSLSVDWRLPWVLATVFEIAVRFREILSLSSRHREVSLMMKRIASSLR